MSPPWASPVKVRAVFQVFVPPPKYGCVMVGLSAALGPEGNMNLDTFVLFCISVLVCCFHLIIQRVVIFIPLFLFAPSRWFSRSLPRFPKKKK